MRNKRYHSTLTTIISIFMLVIGSAGEAHAQIQWSEPVQLTDSIGFQDPRAAIMGTSIHVVGGVDPIEFFYVRSTDGGFTWSYPITPAPADTFNGCSQPDIVCSNGKVHLAFLAKPFGQLRAQVYHISSFDTGRTWTAPHQVFRRRDTFNLMKYPRVTANGDTLFLSCRLGDTSHDYLLSFRSFNAGVTWRDSTVADPLTWGLDQDHSMFYSNGNIHIVYPLHFEGVDIFHTMSTDLGITWTERERLSTQDNIAGQAPSGHADSAGHVMAAWFDYKYGSMCGFTGDILTRSSTDNGQTWLPEGRVTYTQSGNASSCFVDGSTTHIIWNDSWPFGCLTAKIEFSRSEDYGQSWSEPELMSGNYPSYDRASTIVESISGDTTIIHCFWDRGSDMGSDLYYVRGLIAPTAIHDRDDVGIPNKLALSAYPNPFNSSVSIEYIFPNEKGAEIAIYNVQGQLLQSFRVEGKQGKINWDATDASGKKVSSGLYLARARTPQSSSTIMLYCVK